MLVASDAFNVAAREGRVLARAFLTLRDGTAVTFGPSDIMQDGVSFTSATSGAGSFDVGAAIIGRCELCLRNESRQLDGYDLGGALVVPYIGARVGNSMEWLRKGTYWVEPFEAYDEVVRVSCVDSMSLLEVPYSQVPTAYPASLGRIVRDICEVCGLPLASRSFPHSDYVVQGRPSDDGATCLEVVGWAAQVAGCFADVDSMGRLRIRWYDLSAFDPEGGLDGGAFHVEADSADGGGFHYEADSCVGGSLVDPLGVTAIKSIRAGIATREVTGLAVTAWQERTSGGSDGEQFVEGADDYVIHVEDNPLVEYGRAEEVAAMVAPSVLGLMLRQASATVLGSPTFEAGDPMVVTDRHGITYRFWATRVTWSSSGSLTVSCDVRTSSPLVVAQRRTQQQAQESAWQGEMVAQVEDMIQQFSDELYGSDAFQMAEDVGADITNMGLDELADKDGAFAELEELCGYKWEFQVNGVPKETGTINFITGPQP